MGVVIAGSGEIAVRADAAGAGPENKGLVIAGFKSQGLCSQRLALEIAGRRLAF